MFFKVKAAPFKKLHFRLLIYLVAALILAMPARTALEHHFLYFPEPHHQETPAAVGLTYEEISFQATDDTQLTGWLIPGQDKAPVVLFCMGNAGNISHRLETLLMLRELGVTSFIFNYRGYGKSDGKASESGLYHDVSGAMKFLEDRGWATEQIIIFGRSLGAAVALEAALRSQPAGLIMEAAFTSISAMGQHHYPVLNFLLGWLLDARYDNLGKIPELNSPLLLIHGQKDTVCPPSMAEALYVLGPYEKNILWLPGADHNNSFMVGGDSYRQTLKQSIKQWTGFAGGD